MVITGKASDLCGLTLKVGLLIGGKIGSKLQSKASLIISATLSNNAKGDNPMPSIDIHLIDSSGGAPEPSNAPSPRGAAQRIDTPDTRRADEMRKQRNEQNKPGTTASGLRDDLKSFAVNRARRMTESMIGAGATDLLALLMKARNQKPSERKAEPRITSTDRQRSAPGQRTETTLDDKALRDSLRQHPQDVRRVLAEALAELNKTLAKRRSPADRRPAAPDRFSPRRSADQPRRTPEQGPVREAGAARRRRSEAKPVEPQPFKATPRRAPQSPIVPQTPRRPAALNVPLLPAPTRRIEPRQLMLPAPQPRPAEPRPLMLPPPRAISVPHREPGGRWIAPATPIRRRPEPGRQLVVGTRGQMTLPPRPGVPMAGLAARAGGAASALARLAAFAGPLGIAATGATAGLMAMIYAAKKVSGEFDRMADHQRNYSAAIQLADARIQLRRINFDIEQANRHGRGVAEIMNQKDKVAIEVERLRNELTSWLKGDLAQFLSLATMAIKAANAGVKAARDLNLDTPAQMIARDLLNKMGLGPLVDLWKEYIRRSGKAQDDMTEELKEMNKLLEQAVGQGGAPWMNAIFGADPNPPVVRWGGDVFGDQGGPGVQNAQVRWQGGPAARGVMP